MKECIQIRASSDPKEPERYTTSQVFVMRISSLSFFFTLAHRITSPKAKTVLLYKKHYNKIWNIKICHWLPRGSKMLKYHSHSKHD